LKSKILKNFVIKTTKKARQQHPRLVKDNNRVGGVFLCA
jgi:hypothetical protein